MKEPLITIIVNLAFININDCFHTKKNMCPAVSPQPWRSFLWRRGLRWMFSTQAALATCSAAEMVMVNPSESIKNILTHSKSPIWLDKSLWSSKDMIVQSRLSDAKFIGIWMGKAKSKRSWNCFICLHHVGNLLIYDGFSPHHKFDCLRSGWGRFTTLYTYIHIYNI